MLLKIQVFRDVTLSASKWLPTFRRSLLTNFRRPMILYPSIWHSIPEDLTLRRIFSFGNKGNSAEPSFVEPVFVCVCVCVCVDVKVKGFQFRLLRHTDSMFPIQRASLSWLFKFWCPSRNRRRTRWRTGCDVHSSIIFFPSPTLKFPLPIFICLSLYNIYPTFFLVLWGSLHQARETFLTPLPDSLVHIQICYGFLSSI